MEPPREKEARKTKQSWRRTWVIKELESIGKTWGEAEKIAINRVRSYASRGAKRIKQSSNLLPCSCHLFDSWHQQETEDRYSQNPCETGILSASLLVWNRMSSMVSFLWKRPISEAFSKNPHVSSKTPFWGNIHKSIMRTPPVYLEQRSYFIPLYFEYFLTCNATPNVRSNSWTSSSFFFANVLLFSTINSRYRDCCTCDTPRESPCIRTSSLLFT